MTPNLNNCDNECRWTVSTEPMKNKRLKKNMKMVVKISWKSLNCLRLEC